MSAIAWIMLAVGEVILAALLTVGVRYVAQRVRLVDKPTGEGKKIHVRPIPLGGGVAVILAWSIGVVLLWSSLTHGYVLPKHLVGILIGAGLLAIGGVLDDRFQLKPHLQLVAPFLAVCVVVASGIGVSSVTSPFGGTIMLDQWSIPLFTWGGVPYHLTVFADLFAFIWLMGMMYTTKLLDGIDGLVSSVTLVGACFLALLSFTARVNQPETGTLALLLACAFCGFLIFNWHPASIFLGEAGSLFAGFMLGVLSIFSGAKVATTLLIFALPILDVAWVIGRRVLVEKRSPFMGDRLHLHQRLLDAGFSQRQTVTILLSLTIAFGACGLLFETRQKIIALCIAMLCMVIFGFLLSRQKKQQ